MKSPEWYSAIKRELEKNPNLITQMKAEQMTEKLRKNIIKKMATLEQKLEVL